MANAATQWGAELRARRCCRIGDVLTGSSAKQMVCSARVPVLLARWPCRPNQETQRSGEHILNDMSQLAGFRRIYVNRSTQRVGRQCRYRPPEYGRYP